MIEVGLEKIPRALTIAGSDSGGGAGIQADLKVFAALGVHGMSAVTAITAQNTLEVTAIQGVNLDVIDAQIEAVIQDIGIDAAKTGMLYNREIIDLVADKVEKYSIPTVVDPVMVSKSGSVLLKPNAVKILKKKLLPLAKIVTPNAMEAEALTGIHVNSVVKAREAAEVINKMGPEAVLIKGGHIAEEQSKAIDVLYWQGEHLILEGKRFAARDTHGTGCSLSAAIAAELAKGSDVKDAARRAKEYVSFSILHGLRIGQGHGPLNNMAEIRNASEKYYVLADIRKAIKIIESEPAMVRLLAEVQMNIGMALPYASSISEVAAVEGRLTCRGGHVLASGCPWYGVSSHISQTILAVKRFDSTKRAAVNLRFSEDIVETCKALGYVISWYDRREEPKESKVREGSTTFWGAEQAVKRIDRVPDVIYHLGDWGKEPMVVLIGKSAVQVAERAVAIARKLGGISNRAL